jgi:P4 family phage/plasmid primase-like protien
MDINKDQLLEQQFSSLEANNNNLDAYDFIVRAIIDSHPIKTNKLRKRLSHITNHPISEVKEAEKFLKSRPLTHREIADLFIESLGSISPIGSSGSLWRFNETTGVWDEMSLSHVAVTIGKIYANHTRCVRQSDYKAITDCVYSILKDEVFFESATIGINTPKGVYLIKNNELICQKSSPKDRLRFSLKISPDKNCPMDLFINMLKCSFGTTFPEQVRQLRMFIGLAIVGIQFRTQRACFLKGQAGSGKSTILNIMQKIIPIQYVSTTSPSDFDSDYKKASLANKLLNLVAEIDNDKPIPSGAFKSVIGEDRIDARQPYGQVFNFISTAGNWYNGNFFMITKDHTDGFYRRWAIIEFLHAKPEQERDENLKNQILKNELPGILAWALDGVKDYLQNGLYLSPNHYNAIKEWKIDGNSALSWLNDVDNGVYKRNKGDKTKPLPRTKAYRIYRSWCSNNNRSSFSSKIFYSFIEKSGIIATKNTGIWCFTELTDENPENIYDHLEGIPF